MQLSRRVFTATSLSALVGTQALFRPRPAQAANFTMKLTTTANNSLDTDWMQRVKAGVEQATQGKIEASIFPAGQLGGVEAMVEGVATGTIEVSVNASGGYEGLEPRFAALTMPGLITGLEQGTKLLTDPAVRQRLDTFAAGKGVAVITALVESPMAIVSRRPITSTADFKGLKIRVPGSTVLSAQLQALGAATLSMSLGEVLTAFQNGTIDGVCAGSNIFTVLKYYEISNNMTVLPGTYLIVVGLVSTEFLDSLGPLAETVRAQARAADMPAMTWDEAEIGRTQALWEQNGGKTLTFSAAEAARYLDLTLPAATRALTPEAAADYDFLKAAAARIG